MTCNLFGQVPLVKSGAEWYYGFHLKGETTYGYVKMTYMGDSFVQNALHHRILEEEYTYDPMTEDVVKTDDRVLFVRNEVDSLYLSDLTVFNRNAEVGDTIAMTGDSLNPVTFVYTDIGMINIEGSDLQHQTVTAICGSDSSYTFEIVDQIGIMSGPHKHFDWIHAHACPGEGWTDDPLKIYNFRCYSDDEISIMANADIACDASGEIISSLDQTEQAQINIYPNPVSDRLFIDGLKEPSRVIMYDQLGKIVSDKLMTENDFINVTEMAKGIYVVSIPQINLSKLIEIK